MPCHHPSPELLADYAAGSMRSSHALCVAAHLEFCESCRQQMSRLSSLGAALFDALPPRASANDGAGLKQRVLAALDATACATGAVNNARTQASAAQRVPRAIRQFVREGYDATAWTAFTPAVRLATLLNDRDGSQIMLSRVKPGGKMFHHRHTGEEFTVVLEGSFSDETGVYRQGDFVRRDRRHRHKPVVTKDAECICLMVLDAPIQFTGWLARLLNPLLRRQHGLR